MSAVQHVDEQDRAATAPEPPKAAVVPRTRAAQGRLEPVHTSLPERAHLVLSQPVQLYRVVSFLNRTLKQEGFVFGLTQAGETAVLTVYDARPGAGPSRT